MREYGKLYSGFWTSQDIQSMSDDAKILAAYLLTCDHSTMIGCFRLPDGYVTDDLNWCCERVTEGFDELFAKGFATRDNGSKWVVIHKYIKWNQPENPNQLKAAIKAFNQVPVECGVKACLARSLRDYCNGFNVEILEPFLNPLETVTEPVAVTVAVTVGTKKSKADALATRLPTDWKLDEVGMAFCKAERPELDPKTTADGFRDYWVGVAGAKGRKLDWPATWRNWVRAQNAPKRPVVSQDDRFAGVV